MKNIALVGGLLAASLSFGAHAQTPPAASTAKKELSAKIVKLQQPMIDSLARQFVDPPIIQMLQQQVAPAIQQRVAADRRQAVAADIQADARKYAEEVNPIVRDKAVKLANTLWPPILEERFTEDELKQLIAILESPVNRKYQAIGADLVRALGEKLLPEIRPVIEPKLRALNQSIGARLQPAAGAAASAPGK